MLWRQHLRFMLVPFVDTGRVFNSIGDTTLKDWKADGGIGFPAGLELVDRDKFRLRPVERRNLCFIWN
jgi:hypothetical protein